MLHTILDEKLNRREFTHCNLLGLGGGIVASKQPVIHRTIAGQTRASLDAYVYTEFRDNSIRDLTAEWHHEAITLWLWGLRLCEGAFSEGLLYHCGADLGSDDCQAYWDRRSLLALGCRGAKPALDLLLAGYYTETFAIERTMLESWVRAVYLRLQPAEHKRFGSDAEPGQCEPGWTEAAKAIRSHGDSGVRALIDKAQLRWWFLNLGAHPSSEGIAQLYDEERKLLRFYPDPDPYMGLHSLSHGVFVLHVLLSEIEHLNPPVPKMWFQERIRFSESADPLIVFTEDALAKWSARHEARCIRKPNATHSRR